METQCRRIVIAVVTWFDQYQHLLLDGMRAVFAQHDVALLAYADASTVPSIPVSLSHMLTLPSASGAITTNTNSGEQDLALTEFSNRHDFPMVHIGQEVADHACVRADNRQGMTALMSLILDDCGARAPVFVQGLAHQPDHVLREEIFRAEITRRGLPVDEGLIIPGESKNTTTKRQMRSLLTRRRDIDAVVCTDDSCALAAIDAVTEAGLRVPEDVVVTGFDNYPTAAINWPSLTTVDQRLKEQGATAAHIILHSMAGTPHREHVLTACELLPRDSTAVGPAAGIRVPLQVEHVAHLARAHVMGRAQLLWAGRTLNKCRTLTDICEALPQGLAALEILRAFLVIYEGAQEDTQDPDDTASGTARLLLDYRDGTTHPVPDSPFPARDLLPDHLADELHQGFLAFKMLVGSSRPLGYMAFEQRIGAVPIVDSLAISVSRAIEVIFSSNALVARSATLEQAVMRQTQDLATEASTRRRVELDLRTANAELERSVVLDGLTAIANRAALDRHLAEHWQPHVDNCSQLAVLIADIDFFKAYNDHYGHLNGDAALQTVASCLSRAVCRPHDLVCRFGGEEFLAVLPFSGERGATTVATRFVRLLEEAAVPHAASSVASVVTTSIGIAVVVPDAHTTPQMVIDAADKALYQAKRSGRNQIVIGSSLP